MNPSHENVKFEIWLYVYDNTTKKNILAPTAVVSHIPAYFQDVLAAPEAEVVSGRERDRSIKYKVLVDATGKLMDYLKAGQVLKITHTKHRQTKTWKYLTKARQYTIVTVDDTLPNDTRVSVGMVDRESVA